MALAPGSTLGVYRIIEPLGRGGMASVFRAYEPGLDRYVALKVLPSEFMHDETFAERFRREARMLAGLEHPFIIPIHAYGIDNGVPWMAMRLVAGGTLAGLVQKGRLPPDRILTILEGVAEALDYAHAKGVIHRDVKPQNVLLDESGRVYLADFGIAKMVEGATIVTQAGIITGTPHYMAPEQVSGDTLDGRCDVYALGIITYELLTGHVPFSADTPVAVLMKHVTEPIPLQPLADVPEALMRAVLKAVAKKPADRWPTAGAFANALAASLTGYAMEEHPSEPTVALPREAISVAPTTALPPPPPTAPPAKPRPTRPVPAPTARVESDRGEAAPDVRQGRQGISPTVVAGLIGGAGALFVLVLAGVWALLSNKPAVTDSPPPPTQEARRQPVSPPPTAEPRPEPSVSVAPTPVVTPPPPTPSFSPEPTPTAFISTPTPRPTRDSAPSGGSTARRLSTPPAAVEPSAAVSNASRATAQPSFGSLEIAIEAERVTAGRAMPLYIRVIAGEGIQRSTAIVFPGGSLANAADDQLRSSYGRETVTLESVPVGATQVSLLVGTDRTLGGAARASTEISIKPGVNRASVVVRFAGPRDREVRFR